MRSETRAVGLGAERGSRLGWQAYLVSLALSVSGTAALGGPPLLLADSVWWLALASGPSLLASGFLLGWLGGEPEPLYGAIVSVLYFGIVVGVLFGGELAEALPDPLPGLDTGDSTFFFVWPLVILASGFAGSILGGRAARGRRRR